MKRKAPELMRKGIGDEMIKEMKDGMEVQEGIWCGIWRIKSRNGEFDTGLLKKTEE